MQHISKHCAVHQYKQLVDRKLHTLRSLHPFTVENKQFLRHTRGKQKQIVSCIAIHHLNLYHDGNLCRASHQIRFVSDEAHISRVSSSFTEEDEEKLLKKLTEDSLKNKPFGYYEILGGIPRTSKISDVKHAYFRVARRYHPDAFPEKDGDDAEARKRAKIARFKFDEITEAYQTLMDINQRYFYDQHGFAAEALRQQGLPTIFDYVPKFSIYEEQILSDNETTELEDWFKSQGHSAHDPKITLRQRFKNAYIELRWGLKYHNFPWNWKEFFQYMAAVLLISICIGWLYGKYLRRYTDSLPDDHPHKPIPLFKQWENDDVRDILKVILTKITSTCIL